MIFLNTFEFFQNFRILQNRKFLKTPKLQSCTIAKKMYENIVFFTII